MECFKVEFNELERRIDPNPYRPVRINALHKVKNSPFEKYPLKKVVKFKSEVISSDSDGLKYIGLENIESGTGIYLPSENEKESFGTALRFKKGNVLFPKLRPYLNKVHIAEFDGVCSTEFYVLEPILCSSEYLFAFLNSQLVVDQTSCLMTGNTLPRLQTQDVKDLVIPIPDNNVIDKQVKQSICGAYSEKKELEQKAENLLNSIDKQVMSEMGIEIPKFEDKMCYTVLSDDLRGRLDPYYYYPEFLELEKQVLKNTKKTLGDYIISISSGATPNRSQDDELYSDCKEGIPFLRVQNISEEGLNLDDVKYITKDVHENLLKRSQVKPGNVLVTITGRIASSCVVPEGFEGNINQHSVVIHTKDLETSKCISTYLNSYAGRKLALRRASGGSRPALDYKAIKSIPVILNSKLVLIMEKAYSKKKELEQNAEKTLTNAKLNIEKIILGE